MQTLDISWKGETHQLTPSFDLFMRIEERVSFSRIADSVHKASTGNVADMPMSHIAWVMYCCLRHAGIAVKNPGEVHQALFDGESMPGYGDVIGGLIVAFYGGAPEKAIKKKEEPQPPKPSNRSSRTSKNATG